MALPRHWPLINLTAFRITIALLLPRRRPAANDNRAVD